MLTDNNTSNANKLDTLKVFQFIKEQALLIDRDKYNLVVIVPYRYREAILSEEYEEEYTKLVNENDVKFTFIDPSCFSVKEKETIMILPSEKRAITLLPDDFDSNHYIENPLQI